MSKTDKIILKSAKDSRNKAASGPPTLEAQVKATYLYSSAQSCAGKEFVKDQWRPVPPGFEAEAKRADFLDTREIEYIDEPEPVKDAGTGKTDGPNISEAVMQLIDDYGLDPDLREGPGAIVPNEHGNVTKKIVEDAISVVCSDIGAEKAALKKAVELEFDLASAGIDGTGKDGLITVKDVEEAVGIKPEAGGDE